MEKFRNLFNDKLFLTRGVLYFLLFVVLFILMKNGCLNADDTCCNGFFPVTLVKPFWYYGTWVVSVNNFLLYWLPSLLGANLQDWSGIAGALFQVPIIIGMVLCVEKTGYLRGISPKIVIPVTFILFVFTFKLICLLNPPDFLIFCAFFRFVLSPFLLIIFLYNFYKILCEKEVDLRFLGVLALVMASSSEVVAGIALTVVFLSIFSLLAESLITKNCRKKVLFSSLLIFAILLIGAISLVTNAGFKIHYLHKSGGAAVPLIDVLTSVPDFLKSYFNEIILNYLPIYLTLLFLTVVNFVALPDKKKFVATLFPCFVFVGIFSFAFLLILGGRHHYSGGYWISHRDIHLIFLLTFVYCISISIFEFLQRVKFEEIKKLLILLIAVNIFVLVGSYNEFYNKKLNLKKVMYLNDKIRLFYEYKDMKPVLSPTTKFESVFYVTLPTPINLREYKDEIDDNLLDEVYLSSFEEYYLSKTYKKPIKNRLNDLKFANSVEEAMSLVEAQGGNFDELKTSDFKFKNLSDEKFVLGEK